jgi:hypothetical protein
MRKIRGTYTATSKGWIRRTLLWMLVLGIAVGAGIYASNKFPKVVTIFDLLTGSAQLKRALSNLTTETIIGYAKVLKQETRDGKLYTHLQFVEADPNDPAERVLTKEYEVEGDVVYFDALIVKIPNELVMDGKGRSLYIWRRVYGEKQTPEQGFPIEVPGAQPARYRDICNQLSLKDCNLFWSEIWTLSNDPEHLKRVGVEAIYGNAVYRKLKPGLVYVFKINSSGAVYPEVQHAL